MAWFGAHVSVCRRTATNARSVTLLTFVVPSPTSADAVKIASQGGPSILCAPSASSRLCDDKTNVRLMRRYDGSHLRADCNRAAFATLAAQAQQLLPCSRHESDRAPLSSPNSTCSSRRDFRCWSGSSSPGQPCSDPPLLHTVNRDPRSESRRTGLRWVVSPSGAATRSTTPPTKTSTGTAPPLCAS